MSSDFWEELALDREEHIRKLEGELRCLQADVRRAEAEVSTAGKVFITLSRAIRIQAGRIEAFVRLTRWNHECLSQGASHEGTLPYWRTRLQQANTHAIEQGEPPAWFSLGVLDTQSRAPTPAPSTTPSPENAAAESACKAASIPGDSGRFYWAVNNGHWLKGNADAFNYGPTDSPLGGTGVKPGGGIGGNGTEPGSDW